MRTESAVKVEYSSGGRPYSGGYRGKQFSITFLSSRFLLTLCGGGRSCETRGLFGDALGQILDHVFAGFVCVVQKFQRLLVGRSCRSILNVQYYDLHIASNVMRHRGFQSGNLVKVEDEIWGYPKDARTAREKQYHSYGLYADVF